MTKYLVIPPEGPITRHDDDVWTTREAHLGTAMTDVVTANAPFIDPRGESATFTGGVHVLHIDDWGRTKELPLNRRAWALYGRSPIFGPAILCRDDHGDLDADLMDFIDSDALIPPQVAVAMNEMLKAEGLS